MRNKVLLAVALVACLAAPAFAAVQNVKVSGDIDSTYINRQDFNLGLQTPILTGVEDGLSNQSAFITQTRVRIDADLSDNVSTTVGVINERAWGAEGNSASTTQFLNTDVELYLAYATMREFLYSPLTVTVGRQVFHYGNGFIMGDGGPNNSATGELAAVAADLTKRTSYDGVKMIFDYKPLTLDLFYFKNSSSATNSGATLAGASLTSDDSDVYGINANYQLGDAMNSVVEGYFFARVNGKDAPAALSGPGASGKKTDQLFVPGLRVSTNPVKGLNVQGEVAWQTGRKQVTGAVVGGDNERRNAFAYQLMANYTVPAMEKYKPMVNASFTHLSGDKNGSTGRYVGGLPASTETFTAWDPLNEAQGSGTIYNTLYNFTNLNILALGGTVTPVEDVTASFTWSHLAAHKSYNATQNVLTLIQPDGSSAGSITPVVNGRSLGDEYDANVTYAYTEDVTFGLSLGWYVPGRSFAGANDSIAKQALAHVNVNF